MENTINLKDASEKISPTAKLVAYLRSFTDIPFASEIALESGAEQAFRELAGQSAERIVRLVPIWEARYKATGQILAQRNITQILEIAAGLSPRGLAMTANPQVVYVVTDLPEMLAQIESIAGAILTGSGATRPNQHFQTVNGLDQESLWAAVSVFETQQPIAIISEGLLPYLNRTEKVALAGNIRQLLCKYNGVWITSDVSTIQTWGIIADSDRHIPQRISHISDSTQTNLKMNAFIDENDVKQFFSEAGFVIQEYPQANTFEALSSIKRLNLDPPEIVTIQRVLQDLKTVILTPKKA